MSQITPSFRYFGNGKPPLYFRGVAMTAPTPEGWTPNPPAMASEAASKRPDLSVSPEPCKPAPVLAASTGEQQRKILGVTSRGGENPATHSVWGVLWRSESRLDGRREHIIGTAVHPCRTRLFETRAEAREFIRENFEYIKHRPDLREEPHGWKMPVAVRVKVSVSRAPHPHAPPETLRADLRSAPTC